MKVFVSTGFQLMLLSCLTIGCQDDDVRKIGLSTEENEIIEKAYSESYLFPDDFGYREDAESTPYYENTVSIRTSEENWIELHTDDKQEARDWSETSAATSSSYRALVEENDTEKYFEFQRAPVSNPEGIFLSRVHKSSYFVPSFDRFNRGQRIGALKIRPINSTTTKDFIEYMWANYLIGYRDKVLESTVMEYPGQVRYNLKSISIVYGDFGLCDEIYVFDFDFFIDKRSGEVSFKSNMIKELTGTCN